MPRQTIGSAVLELSTDNSKLKSGLESAEQESQSKLGGIGKIAGGAALAVGGIGLAAAGAGIAIVNAAAQYDQALSEVRTLLGDISNTEFAQLKADALEFSSAAGVDATESVGALYQAISAGVPRENVFDFLETANMAAVGGVTDLETAVDGLTTVVNAFGSDTITAQQASDAMFTAVRLGKTTMDELSRSMFQVGPLASALGVDFNDITAAMATMTSQGTPTSIAMTQLRQLFAEASKAGSTLDKAIREVAGESFKDLIAQGKPVHEILQDVRDSMPTEEFDKLFGSIEAKQAVLGLTGQNFETMSGNLDAMTGAAGATEQAYNTMADTLSHQLNVAMTELKNIGLEVGSAVLPKVFEAFKVGREYLTPIIQGFRDNLVPAMEVLVPLVRDGLTVAFQLVSAAMRGLATTVLPSLKRLFKDITPFIREMQEILSEWWEDNGQQVIQYVKVLATVLGLSLAAAIETVRIAFKVAAPVIKFVAQLILGIIGVATRVANFIAPWALRLVDIFLQMNSYLVSAFAWALPGGIEDKIKDGIAGIRKSVQDGLAGLTTAAETEMESARAATVKGVDNVAVALSDEDGKMAGALQRSMAGLPTIAETEMESARVATAAGVGNISAALSDEDGKMAGAMHLSMADVVAQVPPAMIGEEMSVRSNVIAGLNSTGDAIEDWFANKGLNLWRANMSELGDATYDAFYGGAEGEGSIAIVPTFERGAADAGVKLLDNIDSIKKQAERWIWMGVRTPVAEGWEDVGRETEAGVSRIAELIAADTTVRPAAEGWVAEGVLTPVVEGWADIGQETEAGVSRIAEIIDTDTTVRPAVEMWAEEALQAPITAALEHSEHALRASIQQMEDDAEAAAAGLSHTLARSGSSGGGSSGGGSSGGSGGSDYSDGTKGWEDVINFAAGLAADGNEAAQDFLDNPPPKPPEMAAGGIITRATTVLAGEAGPEAIIPLNQLDQTIGGGTQIIINGPIYGYNDFADKVRQVARDDVRFGGF